MELQLYNANFDKISNKINTFNIFMRANEEMYISSDVSAFGYDSLRT